MTPKPLSTWGRWRREPIQLVGRTVIPAATSEEDRRAIRSRMEAQSRLSEEENDGNPIQD